ncbi:hypothetical protein [Nonomuraea basaltis]|uniref:hypothetical protein n=1 Tax=Nonomuraea basaltis TaxID=2495887 RepID=UPI00110C66C8|nr:hypothetical protein [Nonomuraea basaltis]TMR97292.1 hypothetical protein EJK15_18635 [Nonomuraea basaltis]
MGREPGGDWQPRGWHGRWIEIGDRVQLVGFGRTGTVRGASRRRGVAVEWDDGGTTTVAPHRLKVVEPTPYTPPRHVPEGDPAATPDGAAAYFSRPGDPGDAWVRYDETGDLDGWIRYNRDDPSTTVHYREVFNDPAWRRDVDAMGLREAPPPGTTAPARPSLADLIPASRDDVHDRAQEITEGFRRELQHRDYTGFGVVIDMAEPYYSEQFGGTVTLDAKVVKNGRKAGQATRIFHRDPDGSLWVSHDYLKMEDEYQGQGFASAWNGHLEGWYRESGLERIEIQPGLTAGGYVWAMNGYVWFDGYEAGPFMLPVEGSEHRKKPIPRLMGEIDYVEKLLAANRDGSAPAGYGLTDEEMEQEQAELDAARAILERLRLPFHDPAYPTPREIALIGWKPGRDRKNDPWLGHRVMAGSNWRGVKWLT